MIRRIASRLALAGAALLLIALLLLAGSVSTAGGTRVLWTLVENFLPALTAVSVKGSLTGPLSIRGLRYADEYRDLAVDSIDLDWRPIRLLARTLQLESLQVAGVRFTQLKPAPPSEDDEAFEFPASIDLPLDLVLGGIVLQDIEFRSTVDSDPLEIDSGEMIASLVDQHLVVDELAIRGPLFSVRLTSDATTRDDFSSESTLEWTAMPPGFAAASGSLLASGGLTALTLEHSVSPPYSLEQSIRLENITGAMSFSADTRIEGTRLSDIGDSLPDLALTGQIHALGDADNVAFDTTMQAVSPDIGALSLNASGGFRDQVLAITKLLLTDGGAMSLAADGEIDLRGAAPRMALESQWQQLRWPLSGDARIVADTGAANINGRLDDYALRVQSELQVPGQTGGTLDVVGQGDGESFTLSRLQVALLDGTLEGSGALRWAPSLEGSLELSGAGIDPAVLAPELPGNLQLELRASGGSRDGAVFAQVDTATLSGSLRELPVDLSVDGRLDSGRFDLQGFRLVSGATVLTARGQAGDTIDLDWSLNSPDLGELVPEASGSIAGEGHVGGRAALPALRATLQGANLRYAQYALEVLSLEADVDLERSTASTLVLSLESGAAGDIVLEELQLTGNGTRASHELQLVVATSLGSADLQASGELRDSNWVGQLAKGRVQYAELAPWTLLDRHGFQLGRDEQVIGKGCWSSSEARLCLEGARNPETVAAAAELQGLALGYLQPLLPPGFAMEGLLEANISLAQRVGEAADLDAELSARDVALYRQTGASESGEPELLLAFEPTRLTVLQGEAGLRADLAAPFRGAGGVSGHIDMQSGNRPFVERALRGEIAIDMPDVAFLSAFSPELDHLAGALDGQLELDGSINALRTAGNIGFRDGAVQLATPGIEISGINVDARTSGPQTLEFSGEAYSGEGTLAVSGAAQFNSPGADVDITVKGDAFQLVDTPDARVFVSPALNIALRDSGTRITGELGIPRAEITPRELPAAAVSPSADQIIVTEDAAVDRRTDAGVSARVRVTLGNDVTVNGFGFAGRLTGGLLVEQAPNRPTLGTGELNILDGEYRAYGQGLVIEEGKVLFAGGPVEQPGIQVRAVRRPANNILVGVRVRGPVQEPEFDLFSEPAMSQTETLSWLVLGRPLAGSSEGQGDMLAQAATMLGLKGGNYLADRFGENLGVDSIGFETGSGEAGAASDVNQAALVVGKYLSPDLFVSYGLGLFDSVSTIKLEYLFSESWSLSTESSTEASGGDVNYVIER